MHSSDLVVSVSQVWLGEVVAFQPSSSRQELDEVHRVLSRRVQDTGTVSLLYNELDGYWTMKCLHRLPVTHLGAQLAIHGPHFQQHTSFDCLMGGRVQMAQPPTLKLSR